MQGLCLIIDQDLLRMTPQDAMAGALEAGVRFFQYRNKHGSRRDIYTVASHLSLLAKDARALLIINDHADIACAVDADGVHLGQDDLPVEDARNVIGKNKIIGISTHTIGQARAAEQAGADYIGFGPVFATATKDAGEIQGLERIRSVREQATIPVIAIGGIHSGNVRGVLEAGADGVAVISAILSAPDMKRAAVEIIGLTKQFDQGGYV